MTAPAIVQRILDVLIRPSPTPVANSTLTATIAAATATATPGTTMSSLLSLDTLFSSSSEWLKLLVLGGLVESCRRLALSLYAYVVGSFFIRASFEQADISYNWMIVWLANQPSWKKVRDVQINTGSMRTRSSIIWGDLYDDPDAGSTEEPGLDGVGPVKPSRRITYLPSESQTYTLWHKGRWMTVTRVQQQSGFYGEKESTMYISIMTRNHNVLTDLLEEARTLYMAGQEHKVCVYVSDTNNHWNHVACRAKRSLRSIILDPGIKDMLIEDACDFLRSKHWYADRGIPFRRGYLLYGAPGSGKTSMIHSMAGELGLDVYIISLSRTGLDDTTLGELVNLLPERCIALMEDIDAAFTHALTQRGASETDETSDDAGGKAQGRVPAKPGAAPPASTSKLSLSGLLNALDGVGAQEGRILFATTNHYLALDPALCRPGRMDLHIEFKLASRYQARELFNRFYLPAEGDPFLSSSATTSAPSAGDEDERKSVDSGYASTQNGDSEPSSPDSEASSEPKLKPESHVTVEPVDAEERLTLEPPTFVGHAHTTRGPKLSQAHIARLAEQFARAVPERECSMAGLQGYLMAYKVRPVEAARDIGKWVEKERLEKLEKEQEKAKRKGKLELTQTTGSDMVVAVNPVSATSTLAVTTASTCKCGAAGEAAIAPESIPAVAA